MDDSLAKLEAHLNASEREYRQAVRNANEPATIWTIAWAIPCAIMFVIALLASLFVLWLMDLFGAKIDTR